jgi:hypothetical protein
MTQSLILHSNISTCREVCVSSVITCDVRHNNATGNTVHLLTAWGKCDNVKHTTHHISGSLMLLNQSMMQRDSQVAPCSRNYSAHLVDSAGAKLLRGQGLQGAFAKPYIFSPGLPNAPKVLLLQLTALKKPSRSTSANTPWPGQMSAHNTHTAQEYAGQVLTKGLLQ